MSKMSTKKFLYMLTREVTNFTQNVFMVIQCESWFRQLGKYLFMTLVDTKSEKIISLVR